MRRLTTLVLATASFLPLASPLGAQGHRFLVQGAPYLEAMT